MHKLWTWVIILAAAYIVIKMFKPTAFTGTSSQRGEFGTSSGIYSPNQVS